MLVDQPTAEQVRRRREATGAGMMECKRQITGENMLLAVEVYRNTGDRDLLADILLNLTKKAYML